MQILVLFVLASCKSVTEVSVEPAVETNQILKEMIPVLPDIPTWPDVELHYDSVTGYYWFTEQDVDSILDYLENKVPAYQFKLELYKNKLDLIMNKLQQELL